MKPKMSPSFISQVERGERTPNASDHKELERVLGQKLVDPKKQGAIKTEQ